MPAFNVKRAYGPDFDLCDGVEEGVLYERDSDNVNTGRSCAVLCVVGSAADSDTAVQAGIAPWETMIACKLADEADFIPESRFCIVVDNEEWIIARAFERLPGPVYDCIVSNPSQRGRPGSFA